MVCHEITHMGNNERSVAGEKGISRAEKTMRKPYEVRAPSTECIRNTFYVSLGRLEESGWYWGELDQRAALTHLKYADVGTFLLRDSSDSRYLYALSVRLESNILNIRILFVQGKFMFQSFETTPWETPKFDCVLKLIAYYMAVTKQQDDRAVCARSELGDNWLTLKKPLYCKVPTLQHLARKAINRTLSTDKQMALNLNSQIESFMRKYPFEI